MAFLVIAGIEVRVLDDSAVETEGLYAGTRLRGSNMHVLSTELEPRMRVFNCQIDLMSATEESDLRAACPRGTSVPITGEWAASNGGDFPGLCDIGNAKAWMGATNDEGDPIYKTVDIHIEEVPA